MGGLLACGSLLCGRAMSNTAANRRKPLALHWGKLVVEGGRSRVLFVIQLKDVGGEKFALVGRRDSWVCHLAGGSHRGANPLERAEFWSVLKQKLQSALEHEDSAEPPPEAMDDFAYDRDGEGAEPPPKKAKKARAPAALTLRMPARAPAAHPGESGRRSVRVLSDSVRYKCGAWIHVDDIVWALDYIADEVDVGGVPLDVEPETPPRPEKSAEEVKFDSRSRAWEAVAVSPAGDICQQTFAVGRG